MALHYQLVISGTIPRATLELLRSRFTVHAVHTRPSTTALAGSVVDEAALRALLILVWDIDGRVLSLRTSTHQLTEDSDPEED